ncbi:hypothetical protein [uncultured Campylobacter sp.]|uniref:hypothetical protein n=1 Tax=uncultured Campylobacter sp. TaxID=218934 RepID=UPI0026341AA0|nr:hypothetical protein [uncultured Campylobacter sp.]
MKFIKIYDEIQSLSTTITKEKLLFDGILSKDELVILYSNRCLVPKRSPYTATNNCH